jgi:hypothetical protein
MAEIMETEMSDTGVFNGLFEAPLEFNYIDPAPFFIAGQSAD